jgi:hypothetical protein
MFISECILPGDNVVVKRQEDTNSLSIRTRNDIFISIIGATAAEVDAMAAAINAPIERMNREMQREPIEHKEAAE